VTTDFGPKIDQVPFPKYFIQLKYQFSTEQGWVLPRQKVFLPGQWKKPVKTAEKTGKNWQ